MPVSGDTYKQIGRAAAGSVCVVAAYDRVTDSIVGLTASSFVTLSFDPPMVMFALQQNADSYATIVSSKAFGVSLLSRPQSNIASLFARKGREKYERTAFVHGQVLHVPLIPDSLAQIECLTFQVFVSGDHAIVVGVVEAAQTMVGEPLLYFAGKYGSFTPAPAVQTDPAGR
jgi:flavin reductase ActVB